VALQLSALNDCVTPDEVIAQLKNLPPDLNQSYQQFFAKLSPHHHDIVLTVMQWLAFSKVPLSVDQICEAVAIVKVGEDQHPKYQPGKKWNRLQMERVCADLVTVVNGNIFLNTRFKINSHQYHIGRIKLAHFTVKEYLVAVHAKFSEGDADCLIAESCLGYLLQFTTHESLNSRNSHGFQLAGYAAMYWVQHVRNAEQHDRKSGIMKKLMGELFQPDGATFVTWIQLWDPENPWRETDFERRPRSSPLYYASFLGLSCQVQRLIEKGADVNAQGGFSGYGNALQAASCNGHQEIVKLLIEKGADVNAQGGEYGNALHAASSNGHLEIVKLLIEKGADVNAQGGEYGNALQAASFMGHQEIVKLLIEKGADVNAQGGEYGNALQAASCNGHQEIVKLLIEKGADINAQGGRYGNALQVASSKGHQEIVKLLMDNGADQGGLYMNVIHEVEHNVDETRRSFQWRGLIHPQCNLPIHW
jgi:ankyrin repeat protein